MVTIVSMSPNYPDWLYLITGTCPQAVALLGRSFKAHAPSARFLDAINDSGVTLSFHPRALRDSHPC